MGKLRTRDRLQFLQTNPSCAFCRDEEESHNHLSQDLLLGVIFKGLFHPLLPLVMAFFGLDGVVAATSIMLVMFKDFALLDLLEGCAPSLLVLCLCMFNAEVPIVQDL
ncbi:hypothetical protein NC652_037535 [Populus alba x Populus x berolinensis]|nr:hypothetical protein NC652_037534 [Populus alba x Populus x berolinensis]KAJ6866034.1 hypothetical protein NC652_037535 [Populus alba x Populus x berolinensis]